METVRCMAHATIDVLLFQEVTQDGMEKILRGILRLVRNGEKDGVKSERLIALHNLLKERVGEGESNAATKELLRKMEKNVKEKDQEELSEKTKKKNARYQR